MRGIRFIVSLIVCFQLSFAQAISESTSNKQVSQQDQITGLQSISTNLNTVSSMSRELNRDTFLESLNAADIDVAIPVQANEKQADPFFMRSQSWQKNVANSDHQIQIKNKTLVLPKELHVIGQSSQFVFLAADESVFRSARISQDGEGLFFIDREELSFKSKNEDPVAVYFLPLPGANWSYTASAKDLVVHEELKYAQVGISNGEDLVPVEIADIIKVQKVEFGNLLLAQALTLRAQPNSSMANLSRDVLPARGSVAGFGILFLGQDLDHPSNNLLVDLRSEELNESSSLIASLSLLLSRKLSAVWSIQKAQAFEITTPAMAKLVYMSSLVGVFFVASVVLKYTVFKTRMAEIEQYQDRMKELAKKKQKADEELGFLAKRLRAGKQKSGDLYAQFVQDKPGLKNALENIQGYSQRQLVELRKDIDVMSHILGITASVASYTTATVIEFLGDKFAPGLMASDNTLIRRFLNYTLFFQRANVSKVPVNAKTFWLGAIVMGGIDTSLVAYQMSTLVPLICLKAEHLPVTPDFVKTRIETVFDPKNEVQQTLIRENVVANASAYLRSGASSYSTSAKSQYQTQVEREAKEELLSQGIDPARPENREMFEKLQDEKMNLILKQLGLPDANEYIVGTDSMFDGLFKRLGYRVELSRRHDGTAYVLEERPGLATSTLNSAVRMALRLDTEIGSKISRETIAILKDTLSDFSIAKAGLKGALIGLSTFQNPYTQSRDAIQAAIQLRRDLVYLSYAGVLEYNRSEPLPSKWIEKGYSEQAMKDAAFLFRLALLSTVTGDKARLNLSYDQIEGLRGGAFQNEDGSDRLTPREVTRNLSQVLQVVSDDIANKRREAEIDSVNHYEFQLDSFQTRIHEQSVAAAMSAVAELKTNQNVSGEDIHKTYMNAYRQKAGELLGLYADDRTDRSLMDLVNQRTEDAVEKSIAKDVVLSSYLAKVDSEKAMAVKGFVYTNTWLMNYKIATVNEEKVGPLSPDQPGRFQKIRRRDFVRNSAILTRLVRLGEAFFQDEYYKIDRKANRDTRMPFKYDFDLSIDRTLRTLPMSVSIGYLFSYYAFNVQVPYGASIVGSLFVLGILIPKQILNRMFRQQGIPPMGGMLQNIGFGIIYSFATFLPFFPESLFGPDVKHAVDAVTSTVATQVEKVKHQTPGKATAAQEVPILGTPYRISLPNRCEYLFAPLRFSVK